MSTEPEITPGVLPWALRPFESGAGNLILRDVAEVRAHYGVASISAEIEALVTRGTPITLTEYKALRANSYERCLTLSRLDDEALVWATEHALGNASCDRRSVPVTYDENLICYLTPLLMARLHAYAKLQHQAGRVVEVVEDLQDKVTSRVDKLEDTVHKLTRALFGGGALNGNHLPHEIVGRVGVIEGFVGPKCVIIGTTPALEAVGTWLDEHNDPEAKRMGTAGRWWRRAEDSAHATKLLYMGGIVLGDFGTLGQGVDFSRMAQVGLLVYQEGQAPSAEVLQQAAGRFNRLGSTCRTYRVAIRP